jgi:hypothetical protein
MKFKEMQSKRKKIELAVKAKQEDDDTSQCAGTDVTQTVLKLIPRNQEDQRKVQKKLLSTSP